MGEGSQDQDVACSQIKKGRNKGRSDDKQTLSSDGGGVTSEGTSEELDPHDSHQASVKVKVERGAEQMSSSSSQYILDDDAMIISRST